MHGPGVGPSQRTGDGKRRMRRRCYELDALSALSAMGMGVAAAGSSQGRMSEDRQPAHRASVARWTTYLLGACLALEAGSLAARLAQRPLLTPLAATQPLPDDAGANYVRERGEAQARAVARDRAI